MAPSMRNGCTSLSGRPSTPARPASDEPSTRRRGWPWTAWGRFDRCRDFERHGHVLPPWRGPALGFKVFQLKQKTIQRAELGARQMSRIQKLVKPSTPVFSRQDWPAEVSYQ
jgi:hypothetical protein